MNKKKRLVFYYTSNGSCPKDQIKYNKNVITKNSFVEALKTDSYLFLLEKLVEHDIVRDCLVFIESTRSPGASTIGKYSFPIYTVPSIYDSEQFLKKNDVLFFRGGFRSWHDFIIDMQKKEFFCMLYAANTGREKWIFWDLILEDMYTPKRHRDERGRIWYPFNKPVNTDIFYPNKKIEQIYDVCIGASHISDKKGQWRIIDGIIEYHKLFPDKKRLKCILPGRGSKGTHTKPMYEKIKKHKLDVALSGMVSRHELSNIFNKSKYMFYGGSGGQNDRSLLESEACGTTAYFISHKRHALYFKNSLKCMLFDDPVTIANNILDITLRDLPKKTKVAAGYRRNNGIHLTLKQFKEILNKEI